jgi:hypothetical protein
LGDGGEEMIVYKVFYKNYELKQGELLGVMAERRKDLRGKNHLESGMRWARSIFGSLVKDKQSIFVVPSKLGEERIKIFGKFEFNSR